MAEPTAYLVTGPDELLVRREAERLITELRGESELEVTDVRVEDLREEGLPDLRTPSLFGTPRAVRIRGAQDLPAELSDGLVAQLEAAHLDAALILEASGTGRIRKLAKRIADLGGRIDVAPPKEWEERKWLGLVGDEFARHGRSADDAARQALLAHAGLDPGAIAEKVAQVVAAIPATAVTAEHVEQIVVGHGDRGTFAVADAMCDRDPARALALLRGVLDGGADPLMVLGGLAYRLRTIVAVAGGLDGKAIGTSISPGQSKRLQALRRNFGPGELTRAYRVLADTDLAIKSSAAAPEHAIEQAVAAIAAQAR